MRSFALLTVDEVNDRRRRDYSLMYEWLIDINSGELSNIITMYYIIKLFNYIARDIN